MKYTTEILINKPIDDVIWKMNSSENMVHWQEGLVSTEHISGVPGEFGAKMKLNYDFGNRKIELIETITKSNFPSEFHATYNTKAYTIFKRIFLKLQMKVKQSGFLKMNFSPPPLQCMPCCF